MDKKYTIRELYEKAMSSPEYDRKTVMLFGFTSAEIIERIEFYDAHKSGNEYLRGYKDGFMAGIIHFMDKFK